LSEPALGVTRIAYVGLREREAVHLLLDARDVGLEAQAARSARGQVSVRLAAGPESAGGAAAGRRSVAPRSLWARLWARGRHLTGRPRQQIT
jgi:hypothetical protein